MTICDNIQNIGNTLENNLNNRGINCTFGIGTDEQTIYDMVKLVNEQNLMGIGDTNIQIIPNRPYVTSGETIDVTVRLLDGVGNPLPNQTIRISDGTNSYNGTTDTNGLFTLFNQTITTDTTYTVTYGTETASCLVEYCAFVDYAVTGMKNTNWGNSGNRITVTTNDSGTTLSNTSGANGYYTAQYTFSNAIIEFDVVSTANGVRLYVDNNGNGQDLLNLQTYNITNGHIKVLINNSVAKVYHNGTQKGSDISITVGSTMKFVFRELSGTPSKTITYKNFRIR